MSVVLITGCSSGLGFTTAEMLAKKGHKVYATMRNPERSPQLQQLSEKEEFPIMVLQLDVLDDQSVQTAVHKVLSIEDHIDVLINNAGISAWGPAEDLPIELFKADMETNYVGAVRCTKAVLPSMREHKSGCIINMSSVAGKLYGNFHSSYCASKAALEAFSECLAQELAPHSVRVALVQPAFIETPIFSKVNEITTNLHYPHAKRYFSLFAAALENHESASKVGDAINDIITGKINTFRVPVGLYAEGFLNYRASLKDEEWINSISVSDDEWIDGMEKMGLQVGKYMKAEGMPQFM